MVGEITVFPRKLPDEKWIPLEIPGVKDMYSISNKGRIYSHKTDTILSWIRKHNGYYRVNLMLEDGGEKEFSVHRLVAIHFIPIPQHYLDDGYTMETLQVNHSHGDKFENSSDNLEWRTPSENIQHAVRTGLRVAGTGEDAHNVKYTELLVRDICQALQDGYRGKECLKKLGLTGEAYRSLVKRIFMRRHWTEISKDYTW